MKARMVRVTQLWMLLQDDMLDDDDRLILDRSPDETASQDNDLDELESDDEDLEGTAASDGERIIYPWMKKIHVAGVGKFRIRNSFSLPQDVDAILQAFSFSVKSSFALFRFASLPCFWLLRILLQRTKMGL